MPVVTRSAEAVRTATASRRRWPNWSHCARSRTGRRRRSVADTASAATRLSPLRGRGMEYAESREYAIGDDARHIDWRLTARSGKPHTKLFQAERERLTLIVADTAPVAVFRHARALQVGAGGARRRDRGVGGGARWRPHRRIARQRQGSAGAAGRGPARRIARARCAGALVHAAARRRCRPGDRARPRARLLRPGSRLVVLADPAQRRRRRRAALAGAGACTTK